MRKLILLLFVAVLAFSSCENTEDNSPALQGQLDSTFFKSADVRAVRNDDGSYTIRGVNASETLTLQIRRAVLEEYPLGGGSPNFATYEDANGNLYATSAAPSNSGEIVLTDRCLQCGWLTGSFNFQAVQQGVDTLTVDKGFFFEVSFLDGGLPGGEQVPNDGEMTANVNNSSWEAVNVTAVQTGGSIVVSGLKDDAVITLTIPQDAASGNYALPTEGYAATYTKNGVVEEAIGGLISVNYNQTNTGLGKIFFNFTTENYTIQSGDTEFDYL
ncbi:MAG: hypothetical protein K0U54_06045 [Bacteroidetes bacterium]|nr:hypothetical protein [Bacteroidota bacterium]